MDDYKSELTAVKLELSDVEQQLDSLLHRQNELINRKEKLEAILTQKSSNKSKDCKQWDKTDFSWSAKLQQTLKSVFNIDKLRPMQLHTMNVTMSNKDCILIMPTGGGKSLCFQLPALLSKGVTLVVSPLVALMEDQVMSLHTYNIDAEMLNADSGKEKVKSIQDAMIDEAATLKLLYVTPEKLSKSKRFMARLEKMYKVGRFSRLVIDEVHCCSQWGHDFRPDYKFLGIMKRQFPEVPILGLTATATSSVLDDVKKILNIQHCELFRASFNRPNLYYEVKEKPSAHKDVVSDIENIIKRKFNNQSGIIYTFSKKECEEISNDLKLKGIKTGCYHADLSSGARSQVHKAWINNQIHVVVATIAFGMGIDKPDVRFVIHHSISKSMENLYQESGRAGRDDKKSHCIVYYRLQDVFRQSAMVMTEQTGLNNLYGILDYCIDVNRCRRSMIARHFDEVWEPSQCNKMCDNCNSTNVTEKIDITVLCNNVLKILDKANEIDNKLTAIKILDAWQGKGPAVNKVKGTDTCKSREFLERILAVMLVKQYIKEDFHFTPYATISYLVPGPKANIVRTGVQKVFMDGIQKKKTGVTESPTKDQVQGHPSSQSATKVRDQGHMSSQSATKVKVTEDKGQSKQSRAENDTKKSPQDSRKETNNLYRPQKRKVVVSNDNDSDLDFGGARSGGKKVKVDSSSKRKVTLDKNNSVGKKSSAKRTIMIDSDSDVDFT